MKKLSLPALAILLLVGVMGLSMLGQWRIDLTEGKLYTLSDGTENILKNIHDPVTLKFYYSESLTRDVPALRNYAKRVEEILREYERAANGKIVLEIIHPEVFSEDEDAAAAAGLQGLPNGRGESIYIGLYGSQGDRIETIALFNPEKENLLEYQISQLVYKLSRPAPVVVGVISGLPIFRSMDPKTNRPRPGWLIIDQLTQLFDIRRQIDPSVDKIDDDLNMLIVVHPHLLPEKTLFAIDQFVLRGGRLLTFVDPMAELDDSEALLGDGFADRSSSLEQLFTAWGIDYDPKKVVLDLGYAHSIPAQRDGPEVPHVGILGLEGAAINREQNVIADLENINVASVGALSQHRGSSTQFIPLLTSSDKTDLMDTEQYALIGNHADLLAKMKPANQRYHFAALVSGPVKTAFPEGKPATSGYSGAILTESKDPIQTIVVADTDVLSDRMWVERQDYYGQVMATPFAANGDMLVNMVDALGGSKDLISLRSRGTYQRPFTRVDALEKAASSRLREQEDALTQALSAAEQKITALSAPASGAGPSAAVELTAEQKTEIAKFQQEKLRIRKNLREVQRQLNSDVERLGTVLKIINIAAVPVLLTLFALVASWLRRRRAHRA
ncbi:MAG TPA: Gldg family protein [Pseudomonadales bacterium]|nr:Gldg family protein [Pseudomonadales bacterium]